MKITIINGSPRADGNTAIMADTFGKGAVEAGHEVTIIPLAGKKISGCLGCRYCFEHEGICVQKDDMTDILPVLDETDLLVLASPIYWFDSTAQLKCFIERMYARVKVGFRFNRTALLLNSALDHVYDAALAQYKAICAYRNWTSIGEICIPDAEEKGSIRSCPALQDVYAFGKSVE